LHVDRALVRKVAAAAERQAAPPRGHGGRPGRAAHRAAERGLAVAEQKERRVVDGLERHDPLAARGGGPHQLKIPVALGVAVLVTEARPVVTVVRSQRRLGLGERRAARARAGDERVGRRLQRPG
jgi:hypothetical protein